MENELRYYLGVIRNTLKDTGFKPTYLVTAVRLPNGAIELAVNHDHIAEKIEYIINAYDEDMHLKTNTEICMTNLMVV